MSNLNDCCGGNCHEHNATIPAHSHSLPRSSGRYPWGENADPTTLEDAPPMLLSYPIIFRRVQHRG